MDDATWEGLTEVLPDVPREGFQAFLSRGYSKEEGDGKPTPLTEERRADLFLAFALSLGNATAVQLFRERSRPILVTVHRRFGRRAPPFDEFVADVEARLFVTPPEGKPRIAEFKGQASLLSWLKVVATRILLNRLSSKEKEDPTEDRLLEGIGFHWETPEHLLGRREAKATFREAFASSVAALPVRDRTLLRLAFVEGLTIDDIGALYGFHRTTAFRHLRDASARLSKTVHDRLRQSLGLEASEYDRWCASLRSSLELSMSRCFAEGSAEVMEQSGPGTS